MRIWLGVKNFAKIESAKIAIDGYTLLVGQNNTGKTFLMQLVQGINKKLSELIDDEIVSTLHVDKSTHSVCIISQEDINSIVNIINNKLAEFKEKIVHEIFGRPINIDELYIDVAMEEGESYRVDILNSQQADMIDEKIMNLSADSYRFIKKTLSNNKELSLFVFFSKCTESDNKVLYVSMGYDNERNTDLVYVKDALRTLFRTRSLFFPSSRTGLMHLYRDFFANKADDAFSYKVSDDKVIENSDIYGGLTQPMYEFLRFLQTYVTHPVENRYKNEMVFFEQNLIEGHIIVDKHGAFSYDSQQGEAVPMYLASSMINEIAPFALALSSNRYYDELIIDEVEASLHPEKQMELVRFFNRLNNKGMKLIISTHSDTFVSKLNNIYVLTKRLKVNEANSLEILRQLGLEESDLVNVDIFNVYEFVRQANGNSVVREIQPSHEGYQFDLFTKSALEIYNESMKIKEI